MTPPTDTTAFALQLLEVVASLPSGTVATYAPLLGAEGVAVRDGRVVVVPASVVRR